MTSVPSVPRGTLWWDFDGTLVSRPYMWTEAALRVLDRDRPGHALSSAALNAALDASMPWHRADHAHPDLSTAELWWSDVYRRYRCIFDELGCPAVPDASLAAIRAEILDATRYRVFDDVVPALMRAAAGGWRNVVVSNHVPELPDLVTGLGLGPYFHAIITSGRVGYEKPHRRLFEAALPHSVPGMPVWMIGDNVDADCRPVCALGMNAVLVRKGTTRVFEWEAEDLGVALEMIEASVNSQPPTPSSQRETGE